MSGNLKMTKQDVDHFYSEIDAILDVANSDLSSFEKINLRVLTDYNCSASKKLKRLKETNDEGFAKRKKCIEEGVENLKSARKMLEEYANELELN